MIILVTGLCQKDSTEVENLSLRMEHAIRGPLHHLHNKVRRLKIQAHHQKAQLHSLAQLLQAQIQAQIIVRLPILTIIRNNQIQPLANKTRIRNQHNHNIYYPEYSG